MYRVIYFFSCILFYMLTPQFTFANDCNNTKLPLDEYLYMGVDELNLKYCSAQKFLDFYTQTTNVDATVNCISAITTIKRVLKKEHDLADPDCKTLFPNIFGDKKEKKPEPQPKPEPKNEQTIQLPYFSSSSADEKEPLNL